MKYGNSLPGGKWLCVYWVLSIVVAAVLWSSLGYAQPSVELDWAHAYGTPDNTELGSQLIQTADSGFLCVGFIYNSSEDYWISKLDRNGRVEWQKTYGGSRSDRSLACIERPDSYIICGYASSVDGDLAGKSGLDSVLWILELNKDGSLKTKKIIPTPTVTLFNTISAKGTTDGGLVLALVTKASYADDKDIYVLKLAADLSIEWSKIYGGNSDELSPQIIQTSNGGYAIVASTYSSELPGFHYGWTPDPDILVLTLDKDGTQQWQKIIGGTFSDVAASISETPTGSFFITGKSYSNDGDLASLHTQYTDALLILVSSTGTLERIATLGDPSFSSSYPSEVHDGMATRDGGYIFCGTTYATSPNWVQVHLRPPYPAPADGWVVKVDKNWKIEWQKAYGGSYEEKFYSIVSTADGGYCAFGYTTSNDGDVTDFHGTPDIALGHADAWAVKFSQCRGPASPLFSLGDSIIFPDINSCSSPDSLIFSLMNNGCDSLRIVDITLASDSNIILGEKIGPGKTILGRTDSQLFQWHVHPGKAGVYRSAVTVSYRLPDGSIADTTLWLRTVIAPGAAIFDVKAAAKTFAPRSICNTGDSLVVTIQNSGCDTLHILKVVFANSGATLQGSSSPVANLADTNSLRLLWKLTPLTAGHFSASATITYQLPNGKIRDSTISVDATIFAGSATLVSSLASSQQVFAPRSVCDSGDSLTFSLSNVGCDTIVIRSISFSNDGKSLAGTSEGGNYLIDSNTLTIHWYLHPHGARNYTASVTVNYRNPDGTLHDTTFAISALVTHGAAEVTTTLGSANYVFPTRTRCDKADSISFSIGNSGCDTLKILSVQIVNDNTALVGEQSTTTTTLLSTDSLGFTWIVQPHDTGIYHSRITVTYQLPDGSIHDTSFSASVEVGYGSKAIEHFLTGLDLGKFSVCEGRDTTIHFYNVGCDTVHVSSLQLVGTGFAFDSTGPFILPPGDSVAVKVHGEFDASRLGGMTAELHVISDAGNALTLEITAGYAPPLRTPLEARAVLNGALKAGDTIAIALFAPGLPIAAAKTIDLDLSYNTDLMQYIGYEGPNTATYVNNHLQLSGNPFIVRSSDGSFGALQYRTFLTKDTKVHLSASNAHVNASDPFFELCIASLSTIAGDTAFSYEFRCGEQEIYDYLATGSFSIQSLLPNPASTIVTAVLSSKTEQPLTYHIYSILGLEEATGSIELHPGTSELPLNISGLQAGNHILTFSTPGLTTSRAFVKY